MPCIHTDSAFFASRTCAAHARAALTPSPSHTPLMPGLSAFHARLAQRSTRDLACLS